jgi:V/A-type H+-transporting ATPase subunit E
MSEQTLDLLIEKLKTEAIEKAEKESAKILEDARIRAEAIVSEAEEQKKSLLSEAEKEAQDIVDKGNSALRVAARDLSLSVRNDLLQLLRATLEDEVEKSFTPELMKSVINQLIDQLGSEVEFRLPEEHSRELAEFIQKKMQESDETITLLEEKGDASGILITKKDQGWSYTISPEQVTESLLPHLNAKWVQILSEKSSA